MKATISINEPRSLGVSGGGSDGIMDIMGVWLSLRCVTTMTRVHVFLFLCVPTKMCGGWHERMIFLRMKMQRGMMLSVYDTL